MYDILIAPFVDYIFMRRALVACIGIALSSGPLGVLLVLRRMSLIGDAMSHAILPGMAIGYLLAGVWLPALSIGGTIAGLLIALASGKIARATILTEDASFTGLYLISLALGILILSIKGGNMNLSYFLFGSVLAVDQPSMILISCVATLSLITLALIYRPLIYECFDPIFVRMMGVKGSYYHFIFLILVVLNLVGACQALGTLMALGIMMLPAITARLLSQQVWTSVLIAIFIALISGYVGLVLSYHMSWPSGPTIILMCGLFYLVTLISYHPLTKLRPLFTKY
jgi:zinc/manganese transport system permease protein